MVQVLTALAISFVSVMVYYFLLAIASISVKKFFGYDKPQGMFYKIIDFPVGLPDVVFELTVPATVKRHYFNFKPGYFRKAFLCFILNVILYSIPLYFLIKGIIN